MFLSVTIYHILYHYICNVNGPGSNAMFFLRSVSKQKNERIKDTNIFFCVQIFFYNYVASLSIGKFYLCFCSVGLNLKSKIC